MAQSDVTKDAGKTATEAAQRLGEQVRPALDQAKAAVEDLANRASDAGGQAMDRANEVIADVAPRARQVASNLYDQGARSGDYIRQYVVQEPLAAMLLAGVIGFALGYFVRGAYTKPGTPAR